MEEIKENLDTIHEEAEFSEESEFNEDIDVSMKYLFSYGSNNSQQIYSRIHHEMPIIYTNGYILDYARVFAGSSKRWKGGIVGLYPCKKQKTYGTLIQLTEEQLLQLDIFEKGYKRVAMTVHNQISDILTEVRQAEVYWKENIKFEYMPSNEYMHAIYRMLQERSGKHTNNIRIRGIVNNEVMDVGMWNPTYGIKMTTYNPCKM